MTQSQKIRPCLWFDSNAEEAAHFYVSLFADSRVGAILHYGEEGQEITGKAPGSVMTVEFQLAGYQFTGLNGGPQFTFTPAISFFVVCETAAEIDTL
jgi:predicted 3-demethylubiquinone-9 3-methyltransferase (glyoxalase superfamily)